MDLKFYLNKFLKADNIEKYTLKDLYILRDTYDSFLENSKGTDPDFPMIDFGDKGQKIKGTNKVQVGEQLDDSGPNDWSGVSAHRNGASGSIGKSSEGQLTFSR